MKRQFTYSIFLLLLITLLITLLVGCKISKGVPENLMGGTSAGTLLESSDKNQSMSISKKTQGLELKDNFLKSKEGHDFQVTSWKFAKAYLSGDVSKVKNYLIDPDNKEHYYNAENRFDNVEFLILKLSPDDIKKDSVDAEYEFQMKGDDSYTYLYLEMKKIDNEWKVQYFGLEK